MANNPRLSEVSKATQFSSTRQPAIPGGVNKKGSKHLTTWVQELLEDEDFEADLLDSKKGLISFKGAPISAIIQVARHKAVNGDLKAMELLLKYGWSQKIEQDITSNGETVAQPVDMDMLSQFMLTVKDGTKR